MPTLNTNPKRTSSMRVASITAIVILLASSLAVFLIPAPAAAESEGGEVEVTNLLSNMRKDFAGRSLSSAMWLRMSGQDPRGPLGDQGREKDRPSFSSVQGAPAAQAGGVLVPFRDPAPAFSRNLLITRDFSNSPLQNEPHIAVNPKDPNHLVVGTIDYNFPSVSSYISFDAGETWEGPYLVPFIREDEGTGGDPVLAFDRNGKLFYAFISIGIEDFNVGPFVLATEVSSIGIAASTDGGINWGESLSTARSGISTELRTDRDQRIRGNVRLSFLDKPWMAIGPSKADPSKDSIVITFTTFTIIGRVVYIDEVPDIAVEEVQSVIQLVRSEDGGRTWSAPLNVSPVVRDIAGDRPTPGVAGETTQLKRVVQGPVPGIGPDGTVYVAWFDSTNDESQKGAGEIYITRSDDGGRRFTNPIRASIFREIGFAPRRAFFRYWASIFPKMAIGKNGEVYLAYTALNPNKPGDDGDLYFIRSTNKGDTWSQPVTLGGDIGIGTQFFPAIATDPNGVIHVMWGDTRDDRIGLRYHIYYTRSEDGGRTWGFESRELNIRREDTRVTDFASNPNKGFPKGRFIGDYFAIAATDKDAYLVWSDQRLGEFGGVNQKIGFARRKSIPSPEVFISPPAGPGGQEITIQGFNLQPDLLVFVQVGGVTVQTERTNADGRFTARAFMPVSGQGAQTIRIVDDSGNVAATSYFTEFGFGDIRTQQQSIAKQITDLSTGGVSSGGAVSQGGGSEGTPWWVILVATFSGSLIAAVVGSWVTLRVAKRS